MSLSIIFVALLIALVMIAQVITAMRKKKISEYQGMPWLLAAAILIILTICPGLLHLSASFFGISWPPAVLLFAVFVMIGFITFNHSKEISVLKSQITELSMQVGILKEQLREMQEKKTENEKET